MELKISIWRPTIFQSFIFVVVCYIYIYFIVYLFVSLFCLFWGSFSLSKHSKKNSDI